MRICDVVLNSVWYDPRVRKQIIEYKNRNMNVVCVGYRCDRYNDDAVQDIPCPSKIIEIPKQYKGKLNSVIKKIKRQLVLKKMLKEEIIAANPDIIHANDLNVLLPCYLAKKKLKCKIVYDSHEICVENNLLINSNLYKYFIKKLEQHIVKRCDLMICVSNAAADYFQKVYNVKRPLVVTNCCLKSEISDNANKNPGFEILNHGQFYAGRGYDIILKAAPFLKEYTDIKIALRGFGVLEDELRKLADDMNSDNVVFYPPVKVEELIVMASKSYVGVAITEPIKINFKLSVSNKIFEYAAAGLPVIMSDIPEHRYLNEKYKFGIILENDTPECFAEAAKKLYQDNEFYKICADNSKAMSSELNWENVFGILIDKELSFFDKDKI